jgi:hypothetical protein
MLNVSERIWAFPKLRYIADTPTAALKASIDDITRFLGSLIFPTLLEVSKLAAQLKLPR